MLGRCNQFAASASDKSTSTLNGTGRGVAVQAGYFSSLHVVHAGFGAYPTSYPMSTGGSYNGSNAAEAWNSPLTSNWCRGQDYVDLYVHSPYVFMGFMA
jgi:hypothetical protein